MKSLFNIIDELLKEKDRVVISIDGRCTAGKTTLARNLEKHYGATLFHMDDYFLPKAMKSKERLSVPGGNIHHERMIDEIFSLLKTNKIIYSSFNCETQKLNPLKEINLANLIIVEGVYSQKEILRKFYDFKIFMTIEQEKQRERLKKRNPKLYNRFITEWIPLEETYFDKQQVERQADFIIST